MQESAVMAKDKTIIMRVDEETRKKLEDAASARGLTLTTFVVDAATRAASRHPGTPAVADALIKRFVACCQEAQRGGGGRGKYGYERAGFFLTEYAISRSDAADLKDLKAAAGRRDDDALLAWFDARYPSAMNRIPKRRRHRLIGGIYLSLVREAKKGDRNAR